ncbi:MAG: hypothetical protein LLF92_02525 [Planctomycetaceae bacterium]|nr:hypothetical protein [Planctomycetaceae bacterium]
MNTCFHKMIYILLYLVIFSGFANAAQKPTIYHWDLRFLGPSTDFGKSYDTRHMAVCIQGLANREAPRIFLSFTDDDYIWLARLRESGGLCEGWNVVTVRNITQYINLFGKYVNGVVLYDADPNIGVRSTMLAATTAAGVENAIAVRKQTASGSIYNYLVNYATGPQFPVLIDLTGKFTGSGTIWETSTASTGSAKCDAYIWAKEKYLDTGLCDPTTIMYNLDLWGCFFSRVDQYKTSLSNLDYGVSKKGFCFELSPWGDEYPNDDLTQPLGTDLNTFKTILNACNVKNNYSKMIKLCGYTNWDQKYTNNSGVGGSHDPVKTEQEQTSLLTAYNTYEEADSVPQNYFCNASFFNALMPALKSRRYTQNPAPTYADLVSKGYINSNGTVAANHYILLYMGDYDSASWLPSWLGNGKYNDPNRGAVNCSWAITPNTIDRVSAVFDYMYRHKTSKDYFISGDSGAGYVNPHQLSGTRSPSGYSSGIPIWQEHCRKYFRMLDYSISGWLLNGKFSLPTVSDASNFVPFSGDGIGLDWSSYSSTPTQALVSNVPVCARTQPDNPSLYEIKRRYSSGVLFDWFRTIVWSPSAMNDIQNTIGSQHKLVDAYTFYYLLRYYKGGNNNYRATWVDDTIPRILEKGKNYPVTITVRNDGWDTWSEAGAYRLAYAIVPKGTEPENEDYDGNGRFTINGTVAPGQSYTFNVGIVAPGTIGGYDIYYDMVRDGVTWFKAANNIEWKNDLIVANDELDIDTDSDGVPDVIEDRSGTLYWHPDDNVQCGDMGYLTADVSGVAGVKDCYVNMYDLAALASEWLNQNQESLCDFTGPLSVPDQSVDFYDFCVLASNWMECTNPTDYNCW